MKKLALNVGELKCPLNITLNIHARHISKQWHTYGHFNLDSH